MSAARKPVRYSSERTARLERRRIARRTRRALLLVIAVCIAAVAALIARVGAAAWPEWLVNGRAALIGFLSVVAIFLIVLLPVILEVDAHPRPLSGPGKNPYTDN
jgi:hypothetical protein